MDRLRLAICTAGELFGGVERFVLTLASYINAKTNVELTVVLWHENELFRKLKEKGIAVVLLRHKFKYDCRTMTELHRLFKAKQIDVVHTNGYKANVLCALPARRCGAKLVKTEHGKLEPRGRRALNWLRMRANASIDQMVTSRYADHVAYVTADLMESSYQNHNIKDRSVVHNGIPPISIEQDPGYTDIDSDKFNIGVVGRLSTVKGHIHLLHALSNMHQRDNVRTCFFGTGPLETELRDFCRDHDLLDSVRFMGFREDVLEWVARLDAFVMPSLHEGLPYALLEAMYLGIPVIASRVGGLVEILEDNVDAILVEPGDDKQLASAINLLMSKPEIPATLGANAKTKVETQFMIERLARDYLDLYAAVSRQNK